MLSQTVPEGPPIGGNVFERLRSAGPRMPFNDLPIRPGGKTPLVRPMPPPGPMQPDGGMPPNILAILQQLFARGM
jgi:hypothetical protein